MDTTSGQQSPSERSSDSSVDVTSSIDPTKITRPDSKLFTYYLLVSICTGPGVVFALPALWLRYATLLYGFDAEGVSMRRGLFFQKEVQLTYRRIQDIHVTRNLFQRWLGLADVSIQTASGSATPEIKIEGIIQAEALRDYLYSRMRGARNDESKPVEAADNQPDQTLELLKDIRDNLAIMVQQKKGGL
jgi:putative membrane protein